MHNTLIIARKELIDLFSEPFVLIFSLFYFLLIFLTVYSIDRNIALILSMNIGPQTFLSSFGGMISFYGSLTAIIIGYSSIASEKRESALNTLITKPIYRDQIITGKLLGSTVFLFFLIVVGTTFFISFSFFFYSGIFNLIFPSFFNNVVFIIIMSMCYIFIFFFMTMLVTLSTNNYGFSLILNVLIWFISQIATDLSINGNISYIAEFLGLTDSHQAGATIMGILPYGIMSNYLTDIGDPYAETVNALPSLFSILPLSIYAAILLFLCYISFLRRDIV